jgi:hypothetical protein
MFPEIVIEKYCLVYCGPERCNCQAGRRIIGGISDIFPLVRDQEPEGMEASRTDELAGAPEVPS